ncbi:MAG: hypothetical protein WC268_02885 [Patescibacteria group bacterium]
MTRPALASLRRGKQEKNGSENLSPKFQEATMTGSTSTPTTTGAMTGSTSTPTTTGAMTGEVITKTTGVPSHTAHRDMRHADTNGRIGENFAPDKCTKLFGH